MRLASLLALLLLVAGCSESEPDEVEIDLPAVTGLALAQSDAGVDVTFGRLTDALEAAGPVSIVAEVDHSANAASVGLDLRPTRVVLFGNPALGTPLMQANPRAGLDLPQNMLVYLDADGRTVVGYNTTNYIARRHGVAQVSTLGAITSALATFTRAAAGPGAQIDLLAQDAVGRDEGIVTVASPDDVPTTYARLRAAITGNANLSIVAELDHQANAASVDMELPPIRLIVFGNPRLGTPLMQASQTVGIDLSQKMLVYQNSEGGTSVIYNAPAFLAERHELGDLPQIATIRTALAGLASTAAGSDGDG